MPLHDWNGLDGWEGVQDIWLVELLRHVKARLPAAYRAYIGSTPALLAGAGDEKPDVAVRRWEPSGPAAASSGGRFVAVWRRALAVGQDLPVMPLPLTVREQVPAELEGTYRRAAADAYLE